jgi:hypothetical protein
MIKICFTVLTFLFIVSTAAAGDGFISVKSSHDAKVTADRLEDILIEKGMNVFIRIDQLCFETGQKL